MSTASAQTPRVVVGRLERVRSGKSKRFADPRSRAKASASAPKVGPARVAVALAHAHAIARALDAGEMRDQAEVARRLGVKRSRVTQLLDLLLLSPRIQEAVLRMERVDGREPLAERALREVCRHQPWATQDLARVGIAAAKNDRGASAFPGEPRGE